MLDVYELDFQVEKNGDLSTASKQVEGLLDIWL